MPDSSSSSPTLFWDGEAVHRVVESVKVDIEKLEKDIADMQAVVDAAKQLQAQQDGSAAPEAPETPAAPADAAPAAPATPEAPAAPVAPTAPASDPAAPAASAAPPTPDTLTPSDGTAAPTPPVQV